MIRRMMDEVGSIMETNIQNFIEKNQPNEMIDYINNQMTNKDLIDLRLGANSKTSKINFYKDFFNSL